MSTLNGYVYQVTANSIFMKVIKASKDVCLCRNRKNLNGLVDCFNEEIPINNISRIKEWSEIGKPKPKYKEVTVVGVLGISAELIQSIMLRLRIYEDGCVCDKEVIPVDMVVGNKYHVTYCAPDHCMYEVTGKLHKIDVVPPPGCGPCHDHGFVKEEASYECVGANNMVYNAEHFYQLDKDTDIGSRVKLIFDTSTDFSECFDTIMLKDIRMVEEIKDEDNEPGTTPENPEESWECQHCHSHHHWHCCACCPIRAYCNCKHHKPAEDNKDPVDPELTDPPVDPDAPPVEGGEEGDTEPDIPPITPEIPGEIEDGGEEEPNA